MQVAQIPSASNAHHLQRLQQPSAARPLLFSVRNVDDLLSGWRRRELVQHSRSQMQCQATIASEAAAAPADRTARGHAELLHGLGEVGDVAPTLMPWLLRLAHIR